MLLKSDLDVQQTGSKFALATVIAVISIIRNDFIQNKLEPFLLQNYLQLHAGLWTYPKTGAFNPYLQIPEVSLFNIWVRPK